MQKTKVMLFAIFSVIFILPVTVHAYEIKRDNSVYIAKDHTVEGNLYSAGSSIIVDGKVKGDIFCAGQSITINGGVDGSVYCAGQSITINGEVGGSVVSAGQSIVVKGKVNGSVNVAGNTIDLESNVSHSSIIFGATIVQGPNSKVESDMLIGAASADIQGQIGKDLHGWAGNAVIAGKIGKNVKLDIGHNKENEQGLTIEEKAVIGGSLDYTSSDEAIIKQGAKVSGKTTHNLPKVENVKKTIMLGWLNWMIFSIFSALLIGLIFVSLRKKEVESLIEGMLEKKGESFGWGLVILVITPILAIIAAITIIGIPLSLIMIALWLIAVYLSKLLVGIMLGKVLMKKFITKEREFGIWDMVVGIVVAQLIFSIPVLGGLLAFIAVIWGLGGFFLYCRKLNMQVSS